MTNNYTNNIDYNYIKATGKFKILDKFFLRRLISFSIIITISIVVFYYFQVHSEQNYFFFYFSIFSITTFIVLLILFIKSLKFYKIYTNLTEAENNNLISSFLNKEGFKYKVRNGIFELNSYTIKNQKIPIETVFIFSSLNYIYVNSIKYSLFSINSQHFVVVKNQYLKFRNQLECYLNEAKNNRGDNNPNIKT